MPRAKKRKPRDSTVIGFRAFEDMDTDILGWWKELEQEVGRGKRSDVLRKVIREHLLTLDREEIDTAQELVMLRRLVQDLAENIETLTEELRRGSRPPQRENGVTKPDSALADEYKRNTLAKKW